MKKTVRCCRECLKPLEKGLKATAVFCGIPCKAKWNNRRKNRGADLYDLFMNTRFNRKESVDRNLQSIMCRMASNWRDEDAAAGRTTYAPIGDCLANKVRHVAIIVTR